MPLPGYVGSIRINRFIYGVKTLEPKETTDSLETSNTESPVQLITADAGTGAQIPTLNRTKAFETSIAGFSRLKLRVTADWGADIALGGANAESYTYLPVPGGG